MPSAANSALYAVVTTDASCGAANSMHDSFTPLGGQIPMVNILLGEIIVGGVGSGLYGMLIFAILAAFIAGLMVGRTTKYLGKKIESKKVKRAMLAVLILPASIPGFTAPASATAAGLWGPADVDETHCVRVYIGQLRQKIEPDPTRPRYILTETGVGYRLQSSEEPEPA